MPLLSAQAVSVGQRAVFPLLALGLLCLAGCSGRDTGAASSAQASPETSPRVIMAPNYVGGFQAFP
jgi:hypothetical protein